MKSNLKVKLLMIIAIALAFFVLPNAVFADNALQNAVTGLNKAANTGYGGPAPITDVPIAIGKVIGVALSFIGVLFLLLMIYGGFTWMLARGNPQDVTKAKDLFEAAIIGLIIVMAAYAITAYIGNILTTP
ncbi:MAG: hypothetical protein NTW06_01055 [Candidatus Falkowbacteria bacterium]|nr:hypothetical protein [Candidatus Falkowbacteria bacterium]